jgi:glycosyltransferase involved in cell wall biosynthesis
MVGSSIPFKVSVITPVYNAVGRVRHAVESALALPEVGEVILIEDGSPDDALSVCSDLCREYDRVRLFRHDDCGNHGAGASRNLGLRFAKFPFVAFLDADDWYLPNRFHADARILLGDPTIDGVYNALGNHYESEALREQWLSQGRPELLTVSMPVPPEELIKVLFWCHPAAKGEFSTVTVTVRQEFLKRVGGFHPGLRLQQDTHLWKRMAAAGRLAAGNIESPVAFRTVHTGNRMTRVADHELYLDLWWRSLKAALRDLRVNEDAMQAYRHAHSGYLARKGSRIKGLTALISWLTHDPSEFLKHYGHFDLTMRALFPGNSGVNHLLSLKNRLASGGIQEP